MSSAKANTFSVRMRLLYLPFLLASVLFIVAYTFLDWLIVLKLEVPLNEELVQYWLPIVLPWIIIFIWLGPRLKILTLKDKRNNLPFFYRFILCTAIGAPTVIAQTYISTATGKLTSLDDVNQLDSNHRSKYYTFDHYFVDKAGCAFYKRAATSGRSNENLTFYTDCACPILKDSTTISITQPLAWLCFEFNKRTNSNYSESYKEGVYNDFQAEWIANFKTKNVKAFTYFDRIGHNDKRLGYLKAIEQAWLNGNSAFIFEGSNERFDERNGSGLMWIFVSFGIGAFIWFVMVITPKLKMAEVRKLGQEAVQPGKVTKFKWMSLVTESATLWLIAANLVVFIAMVFTGLGLESFNNDDLISWGASYGPLVAHGQWWRLFTSTFVHARFMHLFANMVSLFFAGLFLESALGKIKYIAAYLICGVVASFVSLMYHSNSVSIGASGAIMGLFGVLFMLVITKPRGEQLDKVRLRMSLVFIGLNLLFGMAGNVDNAAHIGGLICGMSLAVIFRQLSPIVLTPVKHPSENSVKKMLKRHLQHRLKKISARIKKQFLCFRINLHFYTIIKLSTPY